MNLLMLGPLPPPYGGTTVEFETLTKEISSVLEASEQLAVLNSNLSHLQRLLLPIRIAHKAIKADVLFLHCSPRGALVICPYLTLFRKLLGKSVVVRISGGVFTDYYESASAPIRWLLGKTLFGSSAVLFETKHHVDYFKDRYSSSQWFPNTRPFDTDSRVSRTPTNQASRAPLKAVYFGHVRETKGVANLVAAAKQLPNIQFDVFGPFMDHLTEDLFTDSHVEYCGVIAGEQVMQRMQQYDVLLFPTYYPGEGYPGVIMEAKVAGLAVVTTQWLRIPEIVEHEKTGFLMEPNNIKDIVETMQRLDNDRHLLQTIQQASADSAEQFNLRNWRLTFVELCRKLASNTA